GGEEEIAHRLALGDTGVRVGLPAGSQATLRGLSIEGFGASGLNGIHFIGSGSLTVQEVVIHDFNGHGINFAPAAGTSVLTVSDETVIFNNNGNGINVA